MVNSYTWFILDGRKGMHGMSLEEKAVYRDVLDLIYQKNGHVPDDDKFIAGWIGCDVRIWRRIKDALVAKERIYIHAGMVRDSKADVRVAKEVAMATSQRQNSLLGGLANKGKWERIKRKPNGYDSPPASPAPTAHRLAPSYLVSKKDLSSFSLTPSEQPQPSQELAKPVQPPGSLASALVGSALTRPAMGTAVPGDNLERPFTRAEVGKAATMEPTSRVNREAPHARRVLADVEARKTARKAFDGMNGSNETEH